MKKSRKSVQPIENPMIPKGLHLMHDLAVIDTGEER
jgi:hypothetical protein